MDKLSLNGIIMIQ